VSRPRAWVVPVLVGLFACGGAHSPAVADAPSPASPPSTASDGPPPSKAPPEEPVHESRPDLSVPGYEVVVLSPTGGGPSWGELRQGEQVLKGEQAFLKAVEVVGQGDAGLLADLAITFVDGRAAGRTAWREGDSVLGGKASPKAPAVSGSTLRYWRSHLNMAAMEVVTVDLSTGASRASIDSGEHGPDASTSDQLAQARAAVESGDADATRQAIARVAQLDDREAITFLGQYLAGEDRTFLRKVAIEAIGKHKPTGGDALLGVVLTSDPDKDVRRATARALDNWGQPEGARAALEQAAAQDADPVVKAISARALGKL